MTDPAGFEPAIYGLGGRRLIHARLRALVLLNFKVKYLDEYLKVLVLAVKVTLGKLVGK